MNPSDEKRNLFSKHLNNPLQLTIATEEERQRQEDMARKNPHNGLFGTPPSVNFFTSIDEDTVSDPSTDKDSSADGELLEKLDAQHISARGEQGILRSVDSEVFDHGPFQSFVPASSANSHVVSSPFEIAHYPIEVNEQKKAVQRQISERARMESFREGLNGTLDTNGTPKCLSPQYPATPSTPVPSVPGRRGIAEEIDRQLHSPQHVEMHAFRDAIDVNYQRMALTGEELSGVPLEDLRTAAKFLVKALQLRQEYMDRLGSVFPSTTKNFLSARYPKDLPKNRRKNTQVFLALDKLKHEKDAAAEAANTDFHPPQPPKDHWGIHNQLPIYEKVYALKRKKGITRIHEQDGSFVEEFKQAYITKKHFIADYETMLAMIADGPLKSFCYRRLTFLQTKFQLHVLMNELRELAEQKSVPHRDFYNIRKVDTHIHAASSMTQKHLLRFIKKKMKTEAETVVMERVGKKITLKALFDELGLKPHDLSVDMLDVHADRNTFHRFDKFNNKYNPIGENSLREVFLKADNYIGGKYFGEVLREVFADLEDSKYQQAELRLSIYGRKKNEWDNLAKWAISNDVWSPNVRLMIQIPRLYDIYKAKNMISNFDELLDNIFTPLFEATNDPGSHPELFRFLQHISALDSVDDESKHEIIHFDRSTPDPEAYVDAENPPYSYYLFYMYANLTVLNALRRSRGLNIITFRPHCGEAGPINHLVAGYLCAESISHGIMLRKVPVLQYLFYLTNMGIAMSPLSNNSLFISYNRNPLPEYHMKGLNVSISTDDPLQFHYTKEALMEEYSIAAQVWKLSSTDMCELARNSVLQSGFEDKVKIHWLGPNYKEEGVLGNDVSRTNVPDIRVSFRHEALVDELCNLFKSLDF